MSLMEIKKLLGYKVILFLILSLILGAVLPLLEFFFTIALQGLLVFLGLSQQAVTTLPEWFNVKYALPFLIALGLLRAILLGVKSYSVGAAGQEFLKLQRTKLYHFAIMKAEDLNSHEVLSLFSDTLSRSCSAILDIMTIIISGITCFLLFCGGMYTAPREMLIGLLVGSLLILPSRMIDKIVREAGKNVAEVWDLINKLLIEGMKNNFFIKVHGLEQEYEKIGRNSIEHSVSQYKRYYAYSSVKGQLSPFLGVVTIAICSYVGVMIFKTPPGKLITFIYLFMRTTQSLGEFLSSTNSFHFNKLSLMKLLSFWKDVPEFDDKRNNLNASVGEPFKIQAFKVGQKFGSKLIFKDVDFSVSSGEVLLIKGESGAGKSTLLSIILGLKAPAMGEIHINGFSTYGLMPSLRDCVAYVGPEPFLLNETVEHNLLFGHSNRKEVSEKDLWEALSLVGLDSVVKNFSSELNERLTEHSKLSTGERQRLSLARAVLRKPKIFVLDEATANLDFGTEKMIIERLVPMMKRSLTIIVSHKPSFDNLTDKVLVIKS